MSERDCLLRKACYPTKDGRQKLSRLKIAIENGLYEVDPDGITQIMMERLLENLPASPSVRCKACVARKF